MGYMIFDKSVGNRNFFGKDIENTTGTQRGWSPVVFHVRRAGLWVPTSIGGIQTLAVLKNAPSLETAPVDNTGLPVLSNGVDQDANGIINADLDASDETGATACALSNSGANAALEIEPVDGIPLYGGGTTGEAAPQDVTYYQINGARLTSSEYAATIPWPMKGTFSNFFVYAPGIESLVGSDSFSFELRVNAESPITINAPGGSGPFYNSFSTADVNIGDYVCFIVRRTGGSDTLPDGIDLVIGFSADQVQPSEPSTLSKGVLMWTSSGGHDDTTGAFNWPTGTTYTPIGGSGLPSTSTNSYRIPAPRAMRFTNVVVRIQSAAGAVTVTGGLSVNGILHSGLSISIPATGTIHTFPCDVSVEEGDEVNFVWTASGATVRPRYVTTAYEVLR